RSRTSPNSSSMSRRIRSKFANRSRSGITSRVARGATETRRRPSVPTLERVHGALARQLDTVSVCPGGLGARPLGVELIGEVREDQLARAGQPSQLSGLGR